MNLARIESRNARNHRLSSIIHRPVSIDEAHPTIDSGTCYTVYIAIP